MLSNWLGGNCCLLYTLTCGLSREHEDVIAAGFSVLEHLYYLQSTPYYCGCARRNPQDKSPHSASVALTEIKLSHNCWPRWLWLRSQSQIIDRRWFVIPRTIYMLFFKNAKKKLGMPTEQVDKLQWLGRMITCDVSHFAFFCRYEMVHSGYSSIGNAWCIQHGNYYKDDSDYISMSAEDMRQTLFMSKANKNCRYCGKVESWRQKSLLLTSCPCLNAWEFHGSPLSLPKHSDV